METPETPLQDMLEKYVADGLKRELDLEEAVWRSVPAFVTALGLIFAALAYLYAQLAASSPTIRVGLAGLFALVGFTCVTWATLRLRSAVKKRRHGYPPDEESLIKWARERETFYRVQGLSSDAAELQALGEVRTEVLNKSAAAASENHRVNAEKAKARTDAARWMFVALLFTNLSALFTLATKSNPNEANNVGRHSVTASTAASSSSSSSSSSAGEVDREGRGQPSYNPVVRGDEPTGNVDACG